MKIKTKYILILSMLVLSVLSFVGIKGIQIEKVTSDSMIVKAFNSSGAKLTYSEVYVWGTLKSRYKSLDDLKLFADEFSKQIGLSNIEEKREENDYIRTLELRGINGNDKKTTAVFQLSPDKTGESTITVCVTEDLNVNFLTKSSETIKQAFKKNNIVSNESLCLVGSFDGKLEGAELEEVKNKIFNASQAIKVDYAEDDKYFSVSAYSPLADNYIKVDGKKVNMNLAIRYSSYEDKTYIWLATPVIKVEY